MLLESLVTIALITVIMTALTTFFITTVSSTAKQRSQQSAIQIANTAVEYARGVGAAGVLVGRTEGAFGGDAPLGCPSPPSPPGPPVSVVVADVRVSPWLAGMTALGSGPDSLRILKTTPLPTCQLGTNKFQVYNFIGWCWRSGSDSATSAACVKPRTTGTIQYVRSVVAVTWPDNRCTNQQCVYVTATLLNGTTEPTFNFNAAPTSPPSLTCVKQSSALNEPVSRTVLTTAGPPPVPGCTTSGGVPALTYSATGLPAGLVMAGDGTVGGTATGPTGDATVTLTVRDSFLRTVSTTFPWTVLPELVLTPPGNQSSPVGSAVSVLASAGGGSGAPYAWTATGLPDGLTIESATGRITGTPTRTGTFPVTLTVADSSGTRTKQGAFSWAVTYPPLVLTQPQNQVTTVNTSVRVALQSSGGSGSVTWSDPGGTLPKGLSIQGSAVVGTATAKVLRRQVTLTATDTTAATSSATSFTWTVDDGPITSSAPDRTSTVGRPVPSFTLTASGGTGPYTWSDPNRTLPAGTSVTSAGVVSGTPTAAGTSSVSVKVVDSGGRANQVTFTWAVTTGPTVTSPGNQQTDQRSAVSLPLAATCPNSPCTFAITAGALPDGLNLNPTTGVVSGTTAVANSVKQGIQVTVTDASGATATTAAFQWVVTNLTFTAPSNLSTPYVTGCPNSCGTVMFSAVLDMTAYDNNGTGGNSYTFLGVTGGNAYYGGNSGDLSKIKVASTGAKSSIVTMRMRVTDSSGAVKEATFSLVTR